ncbi:MAG: hypothetical protein Q9170_007539 [Blastenia crenularia]
MSRYSRGARFLMYTLLGVLVNRVLLGLLHGLSLLYLFKTYEPWASKDPAELQRIASRYEFTLNIIAIIAQALLIIWLRTATSSVLAGADKLKEEATVAAAQKEPANKVETGGKGKGLDLDVHRYRSDAQEQPPTVQAPPRPLPMTPAQREIRRTESQTAFLNTWGFNPTAWQGTPILSPSKNRNSISSSIVDPSPEFHRSGSQSEIGFSAPSFSTLGKRVDTAGDAASSSPSSLASPSAQSTSVPPSGPVPPSTPVQSNSRILSNAQSPQTFPAPPNTSPINPKQSDTTSPPMLPQTFPAPPNTSPINPKRSDTTSPPILPQFSTLELSPSEPGIREVLQQWQEQSLIPKNWAKSVEINPNFARSDEEFERSWLKYERHCLRKSAGCSSTWHLIKVAATRGLQVIAAGTKWTRAWDRTPV